MIPNNYPCICGHDKEAHLYTGIWYRGCQRCVWLADEHLGLEIRDFHVFKPDNLKYLELKFEESIR